MHFAPVACKQGLGSRDQSVERGVGILAGHGLREVGRAALEAPGVDLRKLIGDLTHVPGTVSVFRKGDRGARRLEIAQPDGNREDIHLPAGVIDVELLLDLVSRKHEQVGKARAVRRAAPVPNVQRSRWIGGNEFDLHFPARCRLPPIRGAFC